MNNNDITYIFQQVEENAAQAEVLFLQLKAKISELDLLKGKLTNLWNPSIDYSFVADDFLRSNLENDCRRMAVARSGFKGSLRKDDFADYCGSAQLQIEGCLNYYYSFISNGDMDAYNAHGIRVLSAKGAVFKRQDKLSFATTFFLANYEFDLYNASKNNYFLMRDLQNYRNSLLFHRGIEANNSLKANEKESLLRLVNSFDFNKVENVVRYVAKLIQDTLQHFEHTAHNKKEEVTEELPQEKESEVGTYAQVIDKLELVAKIDDNLMPNLGTKPQLIDVRGPSQAPTSPLNKEI